MPSEYVQEQRAETEGKRKEERGKGRD